MKLWHGTGIGIAASVSLLIFSYAVFLKYSARSVERSLDHSRISRTTSVSSFGGQGAVVSVAPSTAMESASPIVTCPKVPEEAVKSLGDGDVTRSDVERIYAFLESVGVPSGMTSEQLYAFKNDLLNMLRDLHQPPADLTQELIRLYQDIAQDLVIRIYALQHLGLWYGQITGTSSSPGEKSHYRPRSASDAAEIRNVLWAALDDRDEGFGGTALLALFYLCQKHSELNAAEVAGSALRLAGDEGGELLTRISAIQVCGRMGLQEAVPLASRLALRAPNVPLRTAAVATLGDLGGENERSLLLEIVQTGDPRLRVACESALKRIAKRVPAQGEAR